MYSHNRTLIAKLGFADHDRQSPRHDLACQYLGQTEQVRRIAKILYPTIDLDGRMSDEEEFVKAMASRGVLVRLCDMAVLGLAAGDPTVKTMVTRHGDFIASLAHRDVQFDRRFSFDQCLSSEYEVPIQKGTGQYTTTIGFADVKATFRTSSHGPLWAGRQSNRAEQLMAALNHKQIVVARTDVVEFSEGDVARDVPSVVRVGVEVKITPVPASEILRQIKFYAEYLQVDRWVAATDFNLDTAGVALLRSQGVLHIRLGSAFESYVSSQRQQLAAESPTV